MSQQTETIKSLYQHAVGTVVQMRADVENGCRANLAFAFAISQLHLWMAANSPKRFRPAGDRRRMRIIHALQIAVAHYERPEVIAVTGAEDAKAHQDELLTILRDLAGN